MMDDNETLAQSTPIFIDRRKFYRELNSQPSNQLQVFQNALKRASEKINRDFKEGAPVKTLLQQRAVITDFVVVESWKINNLENIPKISLIAVGGYGRAELHPFSDIDILILVEKELDKQTQENVNGFIQQLWDIGLQVGHSYRTIDQCVELAHDDITVMTNILESRLLVGDKNMNQVLWQQIEERKIWSGEAFFEAKYQEQLDRHNKFGDIEYDLEPNVKESPGGLRDGQMLMWVTKRLLDSQSLASLYQQGYCTEIEYNSLIQGIEFLWRVRYALHCYTGRGQDKLTFEWQKQLAKDFNFQDNKRKLAVEQFMQRYYRTVMMLRELNDVLMQQIAERITTKRNISEHITIVNERFQIRSGQLETRDEAVFYYQPSALLEIFVIHANIPAIKAIAANTIRQIREYGYLIDDKFRADDDNKKLFLQLLRSPHQLATTFTRMSRYAVLGRYIPEFSDIIGQSQFDLFHAFPVDVHTLKVVANIRQFGIAGLSKDSPIAANIYRNLSRPELLLIAGFFHDIGKGRGGDHSELGAVSVSNFARSHGYNDSDVDLLQWLVANHLLISRVTQREDISDPSVISNFADIMQTEQRLDLLYVLTVADIKATNPTLWNQYRSSLLQQLYMYARTELRNRASSNAQPTSHIRQSLVDQAKVTLIKQLDDSIIENELCQSILEHIEDDYFLHQKLDVINWQLSNIADQSNADELLSYAAMKPFDIPNNDESHVFIFTPVQRIYTFAAMVSAAESLGINILESRIYRIERIGYKLSCFAILDGDMNAFDDYAEINQYLVSAIQRFMALDVKELLKRDHYIPRQLIQFKLATKVDVSVTTNGTQIEVVTADRPGLLAIIGRALVELGLQLNNAKITTLGERVEDVFWVSDRDGKNDIDNLRIEAIIQTIKQRVDQQVMAS